MTTGETIMNKTISTKDMIVIGLMLFALFFGAGNLVFPVMLGQTAGTEVLHSAFCLRELACLY
jgi:branched-subunit amino acid permease